LTEEIIGTDFASIDLFLKQFLKAEKMRGSNYMKIIVICVFLFLIACTPEQAIRPEVQEIVSAPAVTIPPLAGKKPADEPNGGFSPSYSPDGKMIAFLSSTLHTPPDLWIFKADGTGANRLTTRGVKSFRWSPDSKSIMVIANRKGFEETLIIGIEDEAGERRVSGLVPGASIPVYSPDGKLFAFTAPGENKARDLWIGTADGERAEPVTEKLGIRNVFWGPDSRKIYYEVGGKGYGVGVWEMDLATMESKSLMGNYIGTPDYSEKAGLITYSYPTNPGEFEVHTMKLDGSDIKKYKAPRLSGRWLLWDASGKGIYYTGQDITQSEEEKKTETGAVEKSASPHESTKTENVNRTGVNSLWHLNLETGAEERISPPDLHVSEFSSSPDGNKILFSGVLKDSFTSELFSLDSASSEMLRLVKSRGSSWMPLPSRDSTRIAFFTNEGAGDSIKVVSFGGEEIDSYPIILEGDTRIFWLPESGGFLIFSSRGLLAFTEKGPIEFPNSGDHRAYFYVDVSIQGDKVLLNSIPSFGEIPGLYMLEVTEGKFVQKDLRYPQVKEDMPQLYFQPRWSFDGERIAFTDRADVWTMTAEGTGRRWITNYEESNREGNGKPSLASYPVWSIKGDMICYTLTVYDDNTVLRQIWIMKADGSDKKMLYSEELDSQFQVYLPEFTNQPFFDATDEKVIYTVVNNGIPNIYSVDIKDGTMQKLTENGAIFPALLPEEGIIIYTSLEGNNETLRVMNSDGTDNHPFVIKSKNENKPEGEGAK
jgi:Tol biopolymer transport system component